MTEKSHEEKVADMELAISDTSPLAKAFLEDEAVRLASEERSKQYLEKIEEEDTGMPNWMWNVLFFILGMLFCMSIPAISNLFWYIIHNRPIP